MIRNLVLISIGVAIGVWLADNQPGLADSVRGITESSVDAAGQLMDENPQLSSTIQNIQDQGVEAAVVVMEQVNNN